MERTFDNYPSECDPLDEIAQCRKRSGENGPSGVVSNVQSFEGTRRHAREVQVKPIDRQILPEMFLILGVVEKETIFITKSGYIGLGPLSLEQNDTICILLGENTLLLLIRNEGDYHRLVGECFVWGLMDGEALLSH